MKKFAPISIIILALIITLKPCTCEAQTWQWAKSAGGTSDDEGFIVSTDALGHVYITGEFSSSSITFGTITLINAGGSDIFLAKFDASGNVLWAKRAGGKDYDSYAGVSTDGSGNIYVAGEFSSSSITFGTDTLNNTNGGAPDIFLAKYDTSGNVLWAKSAGGKNNDVGASVSTDGSGNVYVAGFFYSSSITFGTDTLNNTNSSGSDVFLAKYDAFGNVLWAKRAGGPGDDEGYSISTDASGNAYVTGRFSSSSITFEATTLTNSGGKNDIFLAKYDSSGNVLWVKSAGGSSDDYGQTVSTNVLGNVYIAGFFGSSSITFGTTTLTNAGGINVFIAKYDTLGNVLWAKSAGGTVYDNCRGVSTDALGNVYIAGFFSSSSITFGTTPLTNAGIADIFIVKYDSSGNVLWAKSVGGTVQDYGYSVSTDSSGNVYIAGEFSSPSIAFGTTTLINAGGSKVGRDIFLAKLHSVSTDIEATPSIQAFKIYPNPFPVQTVLQTDYPLTSATLTVENSFGQTVKQIKNINGQTIVLSRDDLASGLYFIRLTDNNKIIAAKKVLIID